MGRNICLLALVLGLGSAVFANGFVLLSNRTPLGDVPVRRADGAGVGPCYRAALQWMRDDGTVSDLFPQTNFRHTPLAVTAFFNPVAVPVPGLNPGDPVRVRVVIYSGEFVFATSNDFEVNLGDENAPAPLNGLASINPPAAPREFYTPILDPAFSPSLTRQGSVSGLEVTALLGLPGGQIVVAGNFTEVNGRAQTKLARLTAEGALDAGFAHRLEAGAEVQMAAAQSDGKLVLAGHFPRAGKPALSLTRLLADGSTDPQFGLALTAPITALSTVAGLGPLIALGENPATLLLLGADGGISPDFAPVTFLSAAGSAVIRAVARSETDWLWVGGEYLAAGGQELGSLARVRLDGRGVDGTFLRLGDGVVRTVSGSFAGGDFGTVGGTNCGRLAWIQNGGARCGEGALAELPPDSAGWTGVRQLAAEGRAALVEVGQERVVWYSASILTEIRGNGPIQVLAEHAVPSATARRPDLLVAGAFSELPVLGRTERRLGLGRYVPIEGLASVGLNPPILQGSVLIIPRFYTGEIESSTDLKTWQVNPRCILDTTGGPSRFYRRRVN